MEAHICDHIGDEITHEVITHYCNKSIKLGVSKWDISNIAYHLQNRLRSEDIAANVIIMKFNKNICYYTWVNTMNIR